MSFYNNIAIFYDRWVSNDPLVTSLTEFYSDYISKIRSKTNVVYLGIATGRIALEIAKNNSNHIVGIELSQNMIDICIKKFTDHKKEDQLTLLKQDIFSLHINTKNNFFILPFRTLANFISKNDKIKCLTSIYNNMQAGETFIFDTYIFDKKKAQKYDNKHQLGYHNKKNGEVIFNKCCYNFEKQCADVRIYTAVLSDQNLENLITYDYQTSWISVNDLKSIIDNVGFKVKETIFRDYHQIWILDK